MSSGAVTNNNINNTAIENCNKQIAVTDTRDQFVAGRKRPLPSDFSSVPAKRANTEQASTIMNMNGQPLNEIPGNEANISQIFDEVVTTTNMKLDDQIDLSRRQSIGNGNVQRVLAIPGIKCGLIIGKNGETIKSLQETFGVRMLLIQDDHAVSYGSKPLRVSGNPDKVDHACRTIEIIINTEDGRVTYAKSVGEVIVPRSAVGLIVGKGGETIKRLINESGCNIQFKIEDPNLATRCATLHGTPHQIARATQMISDLLHRSTNPPNNKETVFMYIPAKKTGKVIGKKGGTVKQICAESGASIELSPQNSSSNPLQTVFIIKGSSTQIHNAQNIIRAKIGDGYNPWQQASAYTTPQTYASQWSSYSQQMGAAYYHAAYGNGTQQGCAPVQDYSAQWAEYYRQMGMPDKAALVEEHIRRQQPAYQSSTTVYNDGRYR